VIWALIALGFSIIGFLGWYGHRLAKAGEDAAGNKANKEALNEIVEAARPATTVELERMRDRFQRRD
jgi:hypothetical protein